MQCPKCNADVIEGRRFCKVCGTAITTPAPIPRGTTTTPRERLAVPEHGENDSSLKCPECGAGIKLGRSFCRHCGARIGGSQEVHARPVSIGFSVSSSHRSSHIRKPINWQKIFLFVGASALFAGLTMAAWHFLPRQPLPPGRIGMLLDRATVGGIPIFNDGAAGRRTLFLFTGYDIWEIPSGKSIYHGPSLGYRYLSADGSTIYTDNGLFNWQTKNTTVLERPAPQQFRFSFIRSSNNGMLIAASRENGSLHLFDPTTGKIVNTLREGGNATTQSNDLRQACFATSLSFSPDDSSLASGELNGSISLWNTKTGDLIATFSGETDQQCYGIEPQVLDPSSSLLKNELSLQL